MFGGSFLDAGQLGSHVSRFAPHPPTRSRTHNDTRTQTNTAALAHKRHQEKYHVPQNQMPKYVVLLYRGLMSQLTDLVVI